MGPGEGEWKRWAQGMEIEEEVDEIAEENLKERRVEMSISFIFWFRYTHLHVEVDQIEIAPASCSFV